MPAAQPPRLDRPPVICIVRVADGKLAEGWDLIDRLAMWQLLGVLPETAVFLAHARGA